MNERFDVEPRTMLPLQTRCMEQELRYEKMSAQREGNIEWPSRLPCLGKGYNSNAECCQWGNCRFHRDCYKFLNSD